MQQDVEMTRLSRRGFIGLAGAAGLAFAGLGLAGCGNPTQDEKKDEKKDADKQPEKTEAKEVSGSITAVGSTALQPLVEAASEKFMEKNPKVTITVQGGGSGQGITQIAQGAVQIGNSDVFAESKLENPSDASKLKDNKVCIVGMGPVAHKEVGVEGVTMEQLQKIFTGQITNWSEVGGANQEIVVINRASGSGTRATFEDAVLKGVTVPESFKPQEQDSSGTVAKMVAETPGAISYLAFSYFDKKLVALAVDDVKPTTENVESNKWVIWAYEHMYTAAKPDEATAAFIDFMMGKDVQGELVEQTGYIPVTGMKVERDKDGKITKK